MTVTSAGGQRPATPPPYSLAVLRALKAEGVKAIVHVPDSVLAPIIALAEADPDLTVISVTREEEGVGVVTGHHIGGLRSALLLQSTGLGNSLNALGSLVIAFGTPCLLVVSLRGELGDRNVSQVPFNRAVPEMLRAMGIQFAMVWREDEIEAMVAEAARSAFRWSAPVAVVLTRPSTGGVDD